MLTLLEIILCKVSDFYIELQKINNTQVNYAGYKFVESHNGINVHFYLRKVIGLK